MLIRGTRRPICTGYALALSQDATSSLCVSTLIRSQAHCDFSRNDLSVREFSKILLSFNSWCKLSVTTGFVLAGNLAVSDMIDAMNLRKPPLASVSDLEKPYPN